CLGSLGPRVALGSLAWIARRAAWARRHPSLSGEGKRPNTSAWATSSRRSTWRAGRRGGPCSRAAAPGRSGRARTCGAGGQAGGRVWSGMRGEPASSWKTVTIEPSRQGNLSDAHGVGIARADARSLAVDATVAAERAARVKAGDAGIFAPPIVATMQEIGEAV